MFEKSAFFHEDDLGQIELLPFDDAFDIDKSIDLSAPSVIDNAILNLYGKRTGVEPLRKLNIRLEEFEECLKLDHLFFFDEVFTGYSTYRELKKYTYGIGFENYVIFYQFAEGFVVRCWIVFISLIRDDHEQPEKLKKALLRLGSKYNLILFDNIQDTLVVLSREDMLSNYIKEFL